MRTVTRLRTPAVMPGFLPLEGEDAFIDCPPLYDPLSAVRDGRAAAPG
jgi:hypothetical protein